MRVLRREEKEKKKRKRKEKNNILIWLKNKKLLLFLALSYSAHLSIDVHCNNGTKIFRFNSTTAARFLCLWS